MICLQEIFDVTWKEISNQITKLRQILSQNVKKKQAVKSGQSTDELFQPTWMFWKQLQFLLPVMNAWQSRDTIADESSDKPVTADIADGEAPTLPPKRKTKSEKSGNLVAKEVKQDLMMECLTVMKAPEVAPQVLNHALGPWLLKS